MSSTPAAESFVPHYHLEPPAGAPRGWVLFLHGIYGGSVNWQSFVRRFVAAGDHGWGGVRVDLRMHGESQGAPAPHTIEASARDLMRLERELPGRVVGISGHSFGGKVALEYARLSAGKLERVWVLDSDPAPQPHRQSRSDGPHPRSDTVLTVLGLLETLPHSFPSRGSFLEHMQEKGIGRPIAQWLAKNLIPTTGGVRFRLDPVALRALLEDYFRRDLLTVVEEESLAERVDFVFGGDSVVVPERTRERLHSLQDDQFLCHTIPGAGHWVHADAPDALLQILTG